MKMKNRSNTEKLVLAALMAALACVATMVIRIPIPATNGYVNLGDAFVILSGVVLGPLYGGLAAGIGSALADLLAGYVGYAIATFIIKGIMGVLVGFMVKKGSALNVIIAGILAEVIMVGGYFLAEALFMGYGLGALGGVLGNVMQGIAGVVISALLLPILKKIDM